MPYLTQLADVARRTGRPVVELPGWKTRGHGAMGAVTGVVCHHDASPATTRSSGLQLACAIRDGRPDLDGPLAQFYIDRAGVIYVVAAGLCWHAGKVRSELYANEHALGIEAGNNGVGEPWTPALMLSYLALCRELTAEFKLPANRVAGHREVCSPVGRKIDPAGIDLERFRRDVAAPAPVPPPSPLAQTQPFESPEDAMYQVTLPTSATSRLDVVRVPQVGGALSLGPKGRCFVTLSTARDAVLTDVVVAGPGAFLRFGPEPLRAGLPRVIEMPAHAVQVEVTYTSPDSPIGVLVEPIPAAA